MAQPQEVMARARALQGLVRAEASRTESQRTLTAPVVQALLDAELFYLMVPAALGGLEVDGRTYLEVVEAIAAADGSTGWCVMIGAEVNGMVGVNLPADVARRMLFQHGPICCAGSAIQDGPASIERTGDQYQVSGRWRFASGCQHSAYLFAFAPLCAAGQPVMQDNARWWRHSGRLRSSRSPCFGCHLGPGWRWARPRWPPASPGVRLRHASRY
jgi:alkylation response protein AidB-like acyl-CoA dehydrogenase